MPCGPSKKPENTPQAFATGGAGGVGVVVVGGGLGDGAGDELLPPQPGDTSAAAATSAATNRASVSTGMCRPMDVALYQNL
jgi:hypothetical protein